MTVLYHYYESSLGPFRNLSDLDLPEAERVQQELRERGSTFAGRRARDYMTIRRSLEARAREQFIAKGGRPRRPAPHYMTVERCSWLLEWYERGEELCLPLTAFRPDEISFTYGDLFPAMRVKDGKPYRGQIYTRDEIRAVIDTYGLPQQWNPRGEAGPERYIEAQIWVDIPEAGLL